jgi:DNA primase
MKNPQGELLKKLVKEDFGLQGRGDWFRGIEHDSLVIDYRKGLFFWNKRNIIGTPLDYLIQVRYYSKEEAEQYINKEINPFAVSVDLERDSYTPYNKIVEVLWQNGKSNRDYWYDRCLTDSTIDRFRLGYHKGWYTIPVYYGNELMNIQKRREKPDKFIYTWYRKPPCLFNRDMLEFVDRVVLTEGIVGSILLNQNGIPSVSKVGGALTWLDEWTKFFIQKKRVFIVFDNDDAGRNGADKISKILGSLKCKVFTFEGRKKGYDIVDYFRDGNTSKQFMRMIREESRWSFQI